MTFTSGDFTWVSSTHLTVIAGQWHLERLHGDWIKQLIAKHSIYGIEEAGESDIKPEGGSLRLCPMLASEHSFISWPTYWTIIPPSFPEPFTPSPDASDKPVDSSKTPPLSNLVLRPACYNTSRRALESQRTKGTAEEEIRLY